MGAPPELCHCSVCLSCVSGTVESVADISLGSSLICPAFLVIFVKLSYPFSLAGNTWKKLNRLGTISLEKRENKGFQPQGSWRDRAELVPGPFLKQEKVAH